MGEKVKIIVNKYSPKKYQSRRSCQDTGSQIEMEDG